MLKTIATNQELGRKIPEKNYNEYAFVWSVQDVARELKCSTRLIARLVSDDRIPYAKVGRLVRFSPIRIGEWIRKGGNR